MMQATTTRPEHSVIVLSIPDATVRLLEHVADTRNMNIGEIAEILLQQAVVAAALQDRREGTAP